ncbi:MAG: Glycerophosphocholine phosphodiesterase [Alyxoria varia]|nr:MAG: Glycerophosphocholine phosphodiesterase [Alyxoria varia]
MKFGRNLERNQVPEWSSEYIDYKGLKKLIKSAANELKHGPGEADLAEFFYSLDRNLESVDAFYNRKQAEFDRRLRLLNDRYAHEALFAHGASREEIEDIRAALLELRSQLRKLQWYGEVNRRGFIKITKKLDKKVPTACAQQRYLQTRVDPRAFATNGKLVEDKDTVNTWLAKLGQIKPLDDASDTASSSSLATGNTQVSVNFSREHLNTVEQAIKRDDFGSFNGALKDVQQSDDEKSETSQKLLLFSLQRAISCNSKRCAAALLEKLDSLEDADDINGRNCLHRLVIMIGRAKSNQATLEKGEDLAQDEVNNSITPAEAPNMQAPLQGLNETDSSRLLGPTDAFLRLVRFLLDNLSPSQRKALQTRDNFGCTPLHYAAQYGFAVICNVIINRMGSWNQFNVEEGFDSKIWQDEDFHSPLHLSVMGGHAATTQVLLDACRPDTGLKEPLKSTSKLSTSSDLLTIATRSNYVDIVKMLVEAEANIDHQDRGGETALHAAARFGHVECAKVLLHPQDNKQADTEIPENAYGWTPLFVACVDGQFELVKLLVDAGANVDRKDVSGWTAIEHAALRGHIEITRFLEKHTFVSSTSDAKTTKLDSELGAKASSLEERTSANGKEIPSVRASSAIKSFGHRYLTGETMIFLSLGSMDHRKPVPAVRLDHIPVTEAHATQLDTALSVVVSAIGASGEPMIIDLPVQENISTEPIIFHTKDVSKVKIHFDLIPTYAGSRDQVLGRAIAPLSSVKANIGSKRMNLQGDLSIPIVAARNLDSIGFVNFNFQAVTPFSHPNMSINETSTYWKSLASPMVIGHRGLGKNMASRKSLQLGENTIQSFVAAANLGASYVEFDVQLTKDHVPVIYHDFLVSETGIDAPVHTLTLEQFLHVNSNGPSPQSGRSPSRGRSDGDDNDKNGVHPRYAQRARSFSNCTSSRATIDVMSDRMRHTRDFKSKGYKANSRGNFIQAPFTTLEEMLKKLPSNIGFNIEVKYPMLFESEEQGMDTYAVESNSFVDTILTKVYDLGKGRDIIFSSFNPDICLLLSFKQPSIPVLFLTDAGTSEVGDIRASSLQEAVRFASRWNLLGVVSASEPLVACPRLVKVVKESGLVCVSYGTQNNEPTNVKKQMGEGIDAVIVDSVLAIRKGLTHEDTIVGTPSDKGGLSDGQGGESKTEDESLGGSTLGETSPAASGVAGMKLAGEKDQDYFGSGEGASDEDKFMVNGVPLTPFTRGAVV